VTFPRGQVTRAPNFCEGSFEMMEVGDLVRHVKTDRIAVLVKTWEEGHNKGVVEVLVDLDGVSTLQRWFRSSTQVVR